MVCLETRRIEIMREHWESFENKQRYSTQTLPFKEQISVLCKIH